MRQRDRGVDDAPVEKYKTLMPRSPLQIRLRHLDGAPHKRPHVQPRQSSATLGNFICDDASTRFFHDGETLGAQLLQDC